MAEIVDIWKRPPTDTPYLLVGWSQWADAGSISSALPQYLVDRTGATQIGEIHDDGFYLFQIPGTHDLVRPVVRFEEGFPAALETPSNPIYYTDSLGEGGAAVMVGSEPHLNIERYIGAILDAAEQLGTKRIVSFAGVYGELPYDKQRSVHCIYSLPRLKEELEDLSVEFSDYHGGASVGSVLARRASERGVEYVGFFAFVPTYDFSAFAQRGSTIRIEDDYMAWLGVMRRVNHNLKLGFDLSDLERKSDQLVEVVNDKVDELERTMPQLNVREYMQSLSDAFEEIVFDPLADVWEEELRRIIDDEDDDEK